MDTNENKRMSINEFEMHLKDEDDPLARELGRLRELPVAAVRQRKRRVLGWIGWLVGGETEKNHL